MAVAFSIPSVSYSYTPRLSAFLKPPSKTLITPILPRSFLFQRHHHLIFKPYLSTLSSIFRRSFKSTESDSKTRDGEDDDQINELKQEAGGDNKYPPTLKELIHVYKEAILDGDENAISDIETIIFTIENEKNVLVQKVAEVSADIASGKDKFLRLKADFENFRKRSENDRITLTSNVQGEVIESLLHMVDNFERAKQHIRPETEKEKKIDTSYQGIYKQFVEIMRSFRVAVVETVGKPFDPSLHEAVVREESQEFKEGIIIQEVRRGFVLGDRLLRPAMVKVSSGTKKASPPVAEKDTEQPGAAVAGSDEGSAANQ